MEPIDERLETLLRNARSIAASTRALRDRALRTATERESPGPVAPFEDSSLYPAHTGLPFVVWISHRGGAKHDVRVKVSRNAKAIPEEMVSVGIRPTVHVIEGEIDTRDLGLLEVWIEQNRATLLAYWEGDIDTQDALEALTKVSGSDQPGERIEPERE